MINTLDVLVKARALIETNWTQGVYYSDGNYCAVGAIGKAIYGIPCRGCMAAGPLNVLYNALPGQFQRIGDVETAIIAYNDKRQHRTMLRLFDRAIEAERKREADYMDRK